MQKPSACPSGGSLAEIEKSPISYTNNESSGLIMSAFYETLHKSKASLVKYMTFGEKGLGKQLESALTRQSSQSKIQHEK